MTAWAAPIYECDKRAAEICRDMSIAGFAYDADRAARYSLKMREAEADAMARADRAVEEAGGPPIQRGKGGGFGSKDLARAFFDTLEAPVYFRSEMTGRPSLGVNALRGYAAGARPLLRQLSLAVLEQRRARKIRSTYIDAIKPGADGRVHPSWLNYGAVSGRWACQAPNLMNLPRHGTDPTYDSATGEGGIRSLYMAAPGNVLVSFDASQLEMRVAAYASGDKTMIAACESSDLHATNAAIIFGKLFDALQYAALKAAAKAAAKGKGPPLAADMARLFAELETLRTLAKTSAFAVCYMAEAATVYARLMADGMNIGLRQVEAMLQKLHREFHTYYEWQDRMLLDTVRTGWVEDPILGRRRWLGHEPSPTENANFPIQGGAAALMNLKVPRIVDAVRNHSPKTRVVAQVHDSLVFDTPKGDSAAVLSICQEEFAKPVLLRSSGLSAAFPIDTKVGERWS